MEVERELDLFDMGGGHIFPPDRKSNFSLVSLNWHASRFNDFKELSVEQFKKKLEGRSCIDQIMADFGKSRPSRSLIFFV